MRAEIRLNIAEVIILLRSDFALLQWSKKEQKERDYGRFLNFFYHGKRKPQLVIEVRVTDVLPRTKGGQDKFITHHYEDGQENWRLKKKRGGYIFQSLVKDKEIVAFINKRFSRACAYLLPKSAKGLAWDIADITDDFLHVLLINYLALNSLGFFAHGVGIRERDGKGRLFCGKSGAGKSTTAKLWFRHSRAMILNDDRVIVRKRAKGFFLYSAPWHGEFSANFKRRLCPAALKELFFIYHHKKNIAKKISPQQAFSLLYSTTFPAFWDEDMLNKTAGLCANVVQRVSCCHLGFVNDRKVIPFVRNIKRVNK